MLAAAVGPSPPLSKGRLQNILWVMTSRQLRSHLPCSKEPQVAVFRCSRRRNGRCSFSSVKEAWKADVWMKQGQGGPWWPEEGPVCSLSSSRATHPYILPCCKSTPFFSFFKQCTKASKERKLCCNILKYKSCYQPVQRQHPVFLTHGSDSLDAAPIKACVLFS